MINSAKSSLESLTCFTALLTLIFLTKNVSGQLPTSPTYFLHACYNTSGIYKEDSTYHNNLKIVLSDLVSNASGGLSFYNTSAGTDSAVYGLYYCRGDVSAQLCSDCINAATQNASAGGTCFNIMEGVIYYDECTLHYSNESKVGLMKERPAGSWASIANVSDPTTFVQVLTNNMKSIIQKAAYENSSHGFATGKEQVTQIETLYSLVQCRPDINGFTCDSCLQSALRYINSSCRYTAEWIYVFYPSCHLRYSHSLFYFTTTTPPPPPSSAYGPSPPSISDNHQAGTV